jgi:hypothetical protein
MPASTALKRRARAPEPAALKKLRTVDKIADAAPVIPDDRLPLHDAIERKKQADAAVAKQQEAISRASEAAYLAESGLEKLRSKIAAADEGDVKRAASLIVAERPVVSGWMGESARRSLSQAEQSLAMTDKALLRLRADLATLQDDAAEAQNDVLTQIKTLTVPLAEKLVARVHEHKRATLVTGYILSGLLDDVSRRDAPRFNDSMRGMKADHAREAPLEQFKVEADRMRFGVADDDYKAAAHALDEIKAALFALQSDASAALPELKA